MKQQAPRLYRDKKGRHYFKFFGKKIFIKDLDKEDIIKFYHRLLKIRRRKAKKARARRNKKKSERVPIHGHPLQPWASAGEPVNQGLRKHDEEARERALEQKMK